VAEHIALFCFFENLVILMIACSQSFIFVMEKVTSLALNLEAGAFVVVMLNNSRVTANTPIPMKIPRWLYSLRWPVVVYFLFAVVYDGVSLVFQLAGSDLL
jgi:hypothetical protein